MHFFRTIVVFVSSIIILGGNCEAKFHQATSNSSQTSSSQLRTRCAQLAINDCSGNLKQLKFIIDVHEAFPGKTLPIPFYANVDLETAKKIFKRILGGYSKDSPGHIYVFSKVDEMNVPIRPNEYKIGRTTTTVEKRLRAWTSQCGEKILKQRSWEVSANTMAETLIHMEMKGRGMWMGLVPGTGKCVGITHQEWFKSDLRKVEEIIKYWVKYVNSLSASQRKSHNSL